LHDIISDCYQPLLEKQGFSQIQDNGGWNSTGVCWRLSSEIGEGFYWIYAQKDLFDIKIHDFYFHEDSFMEFVLPECLSITQYESISGEELSPYRKLSAGCIKTFIGGHEPYQVLIHKKIPIRSIGIEIMPPYYNDYLKKQYPGEYTNPLSAFRQIDQIMKFPEMARVLHQIKNYRGKGIAARLFYEGKVAEAVSLVVEHQQLKDTEKKQLSNQDIAQLKIVTTYLNEHYTYDVPLERLAKIACMGTTKLKMTFKQMHYCTITEYIQQRRMNQAEQLLSKTDLTIGQVAQAVGYSSASRFAELFRKKTGILPLEYRKITHE
jgi:AraC-like DNA-binding protein